jgi:hypothetical protein
MVETTIDLSELSRHEFVIKADFDALTRNFASHNSSTSSFHRFSRFTSRSRSCASVPS